MTPKKVRLDVLLVERGLIETREKAKRSVMAGLVFSETERLDKPGVKVAVDIPLTVKGKPTPYVGRGGLKLEKALQFFNLSVKGRLMVDIGASTGGFTDCALQNGAKLCYALDVGYNQLAWKLRCDSRVIVMERTNFRYATQDMFDHGLPDFATIDVSFISLKLILPALANIIADNGDVVALIKPQFEAGREQVGKKGIVRDPDVHRDVLASIITFAHELQFELQGLTFSPITGGDGNIEFLAHFKAKQNDQIKQSNWQDKIVNVVQQAHDMLD
ncbi:TlyA family RNA methyltransferase [Amphibacillus cookii]|uniref:TlyA family RNA methyltransferase n=1 Tax=Amphibacillus cookii TaxID=767787 RepID=UPI0019596E40|nr:TlyA family RNA methyltransferase [Amphibacillus cookii]MBM7542445.1 23S rRNA (cytidine1920-2'-O)/16S rRNA (cytidine1409-2'-O)-methyltransferase [Amphibacillus cookii]